MAVSDSKPGDEQVVDTSRVLRVRMRADLEIVAQKWQGREYWVIKDPIALKYYRFEAEELAILKMLDGQRSAEEIRDEFEASFAPQRLANAELHQLIGMLHRSSLVVSDATGQGDRLHKRWSENFARERKQAFTNPLAIRFRGVDPGRFLDWLDEYCGWLCSWPAFIFVAMLGIAALGLVFTNFAELSAKMPAFEEFFAGSNWIWIGLVLIVTKIIHEMGHGLACRRFGGECNEMGLMLLVLMPCLYCNVSDSWMLPNKWKRAAIAAAGMYAELAMASFATFVWWFSEPGLVNQLALNVMIVCSVTTLLFNANPLLKYDGYYILSDLIEIPNLRQKATSLLNRTASHWLLGLENRVDPFLPVRRRWFFVLFAISAAAYRWVITFSIFWFLYRMLEPWGLKVVGQMLAVATIWSLIGMPIVQLVKFFSVPGRWLAVKRVRLATGLAIIATVLGVVLLFPVPHKVRCSFFAQPARTGNVFVSVPGFVQEIHVKSGDRVEAGQVLVTLESLDLDKQWEHLQGAFDVADARLQHYVESASFDQESQFQLATARASHESAGNLLKQKYADIQRLTIRAPHNGIFVADSIRSRPDTKTSGTLVSWHGSPVETRNQGAWFETQTRIGRVVADTANSEAVLAVDQGDIEFIQADQQVTLWIRQQPGRVFESEIHQVSPARMLTVPQGLSSRCGGDLVTTRDANGNDVPQSPVWQVSVPLPTDDQPIVGGATGVAMIQVGSQPLIRRIWREFCRTFRFEL